MKNRKRIIMAFVLVACMLIGVGYAAVESNLWAKGTVALTAGGASSELDEDVYFIDVPHEENCAANVDVQDQDVVIVRITDTNSTMAFTGNQATFTATVQNDASVDVTIVPTPASLSGIAFTTDQASYDCTAGGTIDIVFTITLTANVPAEGLTIGSASADETFVTFEVTPKA